MGWVKDSERAYRDGDRKLVKKPCHLFLQLFEPRVVIRTSMYWEPDQAVEPSALQPDKPETTRTIVATGNIKHELDIKSLDEAQRDWRSVEVTLYRAPAELHGVDLAKVVSVGEPQTIWYDTGVAESRTHAGLRLLLTLPAESFDLLEAELREPLPSTIALQVSADLYEDHDRFSWFGFDTRTLFIEPDKGNAAVFAGLVVSRHAAASSGARDRLIQKADRLVDDYLKRFCKSWEVDERGFCQTRVLLQGLARAAAEHEAVSGTTDEVFENSTFEALVELVGDLRDGALGSEDREKRRDRKLNFWTGLRQPFIELKRHEDVPDINRTSIEAAAGKYLALPYRCVEIERVLIDMLIAAEMYAYGGTVLIKVPLIDLWNYNVSPLYYRPIRAWLVGQAGNLALFGIPIALAWWAASKQWIEGQTAFWIGLGSGALWLLFLVFGIILLPFLIWASARAKAETLNRLNAMQGAYAALQSAGPFSARHVIQQLEAAAAQQVVWPAPLYALLDEINARGGRF